MMKHISILSLYDSTLTSIDSSYQMLTRVNDFMKYQGKPDYATVEIVGLEKEMAMNEDLYRVRVHKTIDEIRQTDIIVIPLLCGDFPTAIDKNKPYIHWVIHHYHHNTEIVCLCVGSFFLASTGLLEDRKCAVHWAAKNEFRSLFPNVNVIDNSIITDEKGIYTCGGGYSYLNLLLYIIEKKLGREMSVLASKMFEIDIERKSQNPFMMFMGQKRHDDEEVLKAQTHIENNPTTIASVDEICNEVGVGRRTFERRFKKSTGNSIAEYVQRVKVEFAKKHLESGRKTVNEISYEIGYSDSDAFRRMFKKYTDLSPLDYRKKYA